jgi:hypothetical protein
MFGVFYPLPRLELNAIFPLSPRVDKIQQENGWLSAFGKNFHRTARPGLFTGRLICPPTVAHVANDLQRITQ